MTYSHRSNDQDFSSRVRKPTKGLRVRLRTKMRADGGGVFGKFRTDELRRSACVFATNTTLVVIGDVSSQHITKFEDHDVIYRSKSSSVM
jgi:hypothetical protein